MNDLHTTFRSHPHRLALALAAIGLMAAGGAATAQARVIFPTPGAMKVTDLPSQARAGHTFTLREVWPMAIFGGVVQLQQQSSAGDWQTLASAAVRPRVSWLHWKVPAAMGGTQIEVRFVLESAGQVLAVSPNYAMTVTGAAQEVSS